MKEHWTLDEIRNAAVGESTRRQILGGAAAALGGAFFAPFFPSVATAKELGELKILAWEGFSFQDEIARDLKENGITLNISSIATQDDVQARLVGNTPTALDITSYNQGYADYYGKTLKIIQPIDVTKVSNYNQDDIFPEFYKNPFWYWDGNLFGVVMGWGLNTIVYNPALVPEPKSYKDLLKPEYAGQITFTDDTLASWPMIATVAGFGDKFPNLTKDELAAAFVAMEPYRAQSKVFTGSIGDAINLFVNGEIGVLFNGWSGTPIETEKQGVKTVSTIPEEGAVMWSDAFFIPVTATNIDAAHAYINAILSPEAQAKHASSTWSGTINRKALPLMDEATRKLFNYDDLAGVFKKAPLSGIPPRESDTYATFDDWVKTWEDFKIGF